MEMNNKNVFNVKNSKKRMTFIIGMKCSEGIILIGDTKIIQGNNFFYENKIKAPLEGIKVAVGSAGLMDLSKDFNIKLNDLVQQRTREYEMANIREINNSPISLKDIEEGKRMLPQVWIYNENRLLDDCANLTRQVADTGKVYSVNPIESIVAVYVTSPFLYKIDCNGFKSELSCIAIGSGADHVGDYLRRNYNEKITLNEAIFLGTFLIKYVQELEFDSGVGIEEGEIPQIFFISDKNFGELEIIDKEKEEILSKVKRKIENIKRELIVYPEYFKKNKNNSLLSQGKTNIIR